MNEYIASSTPYKDKIIKNVKRMIPLGNQSIKLEISFHVHRSKNFTLASISIGLSTGPIFALNMSSQATSLKKEHSHSNVRMVKLNSQGTGKRLVIDLVA